MHKKISVLITLFFLLFYCNTIIAQNIVRPKPSFKGDVTKWYEMTKVVADRTGEWDFEFVDLSQDRGKETLLDDKSDYLSISSFVEDGKYPSRINFTKDENGQFQFTQMKAAYAVINFNFTYNKNGQLQKIEVSGDEPDKKVFETYEYFYEGKKHIRTLIKTYGDFAVDVSIDLKEGNIVSTTKKDAKGKIIYQGKYRNNKNGDPEVIDYFYADGSSAYQEIFQYRYDEKGNWTSALKTNTKEDTRTQTDRAFVYKKTNSNETLSKSKLKGAWIGFNNRMVLIFNDNKVSVVNLDEKNDNESKYNYNQLSGELSMSMKARRNAKSYITQFDGAVLSLADMEGEDKLLFQKLDDNNFSDYSISYFHYRQIKTFQNQPLTVEAFKENDLYGLKDADGKVILAPTYSYIQIKEDAVLAIDGNLYGLLDANGKPLTAIEFERISPSPMGYYLFKKDGLKGIMDPKGKVILPAQYKRLFLLNDEFLFVADDNYKGVINLKNEMILPIQYTSDSFRMPFAFNRSNGYKRVGGHGIDWVNSKFEIIKSFDEKAAIYKIKPIDVNCFAVKYRDKGWGLVDSLFNEIMAPSYQDLEQAANQLIRVQKGDKYGLINTAGKKITPVIYDKIVYNFDPKNPVIEWYDLNYYKAAVIFIKGDEVGYLDGNGKEISLKLSRFIDRDYFYKKAEIAGLFKFKRSDDWKTVMSQTFINFGDVKQTSVEYSVESVGNDLMTWIRTNYTTMELTEMTIANKQAYTFSITDKPELNGGHKTQYVFIPLKNKEAIMFQFKCLSRDYYRMAQEFYNIMHSIEINN